jgi:hypothetical protein
MKLYHGTSFEPSFFEEIHQPFFLYEEQRFAQSFSTGYTTDRDSNFVYEFKFSDSDSKVLDLDENQGRELILTLLKKHNIIYNARDCLIENSYKDVGRQIDGIDVDLLLYPQLQKELKSLGFSAVKGFSTFENFQLMSWVVLDTSKLSMSKIFELSLNSQDEYESNLISDFSNNAKLKLK